MLKMKDRTKNMFVETLEEMLQTMPLDKVRVSQLCKNCGATPPTFYYHFQDKYELVAWIYLNDFAQGTNETAGEYSPESLKQMNLRFENRRNFYMKAFDDKSQNSIESYLVDFNQKIAIEAYAHSNHGQTMTWEQLNELKYHTYGVFGMFKEWLFGEGTMTTSQLSDFLFHKTPDFMKTAYAQYPYSTEKILQMTGKTK